MSLTLTAQNRPLLPGRGWWLGLLAILVLAGTLRFSGYNFSLPYVDHPDEPAHMLAARATMDTGSPKAVQMLGYPPGMIATDYLIVRYFQDPTQPVTSVLWMARLLSIFVSLGNVILVGLMARQIAGAIAGLAGAVLWAIAPVIVDYSRFATPDSYVTFFSLLAIYLVLVGTASGNRSLMTASLLACLMATLYKYQAVFLLPIVLGLPCVLLPGTGRAERKALLLHLVKLVAITGVFGFWLLVIYPSFEVRNIPYFAAPVSELPPFAVSTLTGNLAAMLSPVWTHWIWPLSLVGVMIHFLPPFRRSVAWGSALVVLLALGLSFFSISLFGDQAFRQFVFNLALLTIFHGIGLAGWWKGVSWLVDQLPNGTSARVRQVVAAMAALILALVLLPTFSEATARVHQHTLPDQRNFIAGYVDISLPPAPHVANYDNEKTLNRDWGGYPMVHDFRLIEVNGLTSRPLDEWHALGAEYAIVNYGEHEGITAGDFDLSFAQGTTLLKTFPPTAERRGPASAVYWLYPIPQPLDAQLGPVHLLGYRLDGDVAPGETISLTQFWQSDRPLDGEYAVFNHLVRAGTDELVAQVDGAPLFDSRRSTTTWDDPVEVLISQPFLLTLPADLPPGDYEWRTGFYRRSDGTRLVSPDGRDAVSVASLRIEAPG